jgi:MoxR-like ATPase
MTYKKIFDPRPMFQDFRTEEERFASASGDRRDGKVYSYTEPLLTAINVALATGRPLLLQGSPGCGKSSLAYNVARVLGRRYYEVVVHSRMCANDLLWRFDAVRRLGDAQVSTKKGRQFFPDHKDRPPWTSYYPYIEPEVFWWVFDSKSARRRGLSANMNLFFDEAKDPVLYEPNLSAPHYRSVVLLDEIDKAEPDVPNNLLVALGSWQFRVEEIQSTVVFLEARERPLASEDLPLIIITTNEERQLPDAFLRRCIVYRFKDPEPDELIAMARQIEGESDIELYQKVAINVERLAKNRAKRKGEGLVVSVAEYLDAVRACKRLGGTGLAQSVIEEILDRTIWKNPQHR